MTPTQAADPQEATAPSPILPDSWTTDNWLDFQPLRDTLVQIVEDRNQATPLTIGIFGKWGEGKTSLMRMVQAQIAPGKARAVWFDAWRYAREDAPWRALLFQVLDELRPPPISASSPARYN
jgi:predicted KAP-like P-loop ATPase